MAASPGSAPLIAVPPQGVTVDPGSNAIFMVTATGISPLDYQWRSNGVNIVSATNDSLTLTNVQASWTGTAYSVVVTNNYGSVTSSIAILTVSATTPVILLQPQNQTALLNADVTFTVGAGGLAPLFYQWRKNGVNLMDATNAVLALENVQFTNAGSYDVVVTNSAGSATSQPATLTVASAQIASVNFLGGAGNQRGTAISIDDDAIYLSGVNTENQNSSDSSLLAKYSVPPGSSPKWSRTVASGTAIYGVAAASEGVYAAGYSYSLTTDLSGTKEVKPVLGQFSLKGSNGSGPENSIWMAGSDGTNAVASFFSYGGVEIFSGVTATKERGTPYVYAVGLGQPAEPTAYLVAKYDASGNRLAAATDSSVGVQLNLSAVPSAGGSEGHAVAVQNSAIHVVGHSAWAAEGDNPNARPTLWIYTTNLSLSLRQRDTNSTGSFNGVTASGSSIYAVGKVEAAGGTPGTQDFLVEKFNSSGTRQWIKTWGGTNTDVLTGVTSVGGRLFTCGYTRSAGAGGADIVLFELNPANGDVLSTNLYGGTLDDIPSGMATDGTDLYLVGETRSFATVAGNAVGQNEIVLIRYTFSSPPRILDQPQSLTVSQGSNAFFRVEATGTAPLRYQWRKDGANIGPATNASYSLSTVTLSDAGDFDVVIANAYGSVTSRVATLTVIPKSGPIALNNYDAGVPVYLYDTLTLAPASGTYVQVLAGLTTNSFAPVASEVVSGTNQFSLSEPGFFDAGFGYTGLGDVSTVFLKVLAWRDAPDYASATVRGEAVWTQTTGDAAPTPAVLQMPAVVMMPLSGSAPSISAQPQSQTVMQGGTILLSVTVSGADPLSYQWIKDGVILTDGPNVSGTGAALLEITAASPVDEGAYTVRISNPIGSVTSQVASVTVPVPPYLISQTGDWIARVGDSVQFSVEAAGTAPLSYQWSKDGVPLASATNFLLTFDGAIVADAGTYSAVIGNSVGSITSAPALLMILQPDLTVDSLAASPNFIRAGQPFSAFVTIRNIGDDFASAGPGTNIEARFYLDTNMAGMVTFAGLAPGQSITLGVTNTAPGLATNFTLRVVVDSANAVAESSETNNDAQVALVVNPVTPPNDYFTNRIALTNFDATVSGFNINASVEPGEPLHEGLARQNSVWWQWTAPVSGIVTLTTVGSTFDTVMSVYAGSTIGGLTRVAGDDDSGGGGTSLTTFSVTAGTAYQIAVDGYGGAVGQITLSVHLNPPPAVLLTSPVNGDAFLAPTNLVLAATATDANGSVSLVEFYNGTSLLGSSTNPPYVLVLSNVPVGTYTFSARAVDNEGASAISGIVTNTVDFPVPPNDQITNSTILSGSAANASGFNQRATLEAGEPQHVPDHLDSHSVWWRWTAPNDGLVTLDTRGTGFDTLLAVYSLTAELNPVSVTNLTLVASDDDNGGAGTSLLTFPAQSGRTYYFVVDGYDGAVGDIFLNLALNALVRIAITNPVSGASNFIAPASLTITAEASASGGQVIRVEFYQDGTLLGVRTNAGTIFNYSWTNVASGHYVLSALAVDNQGVAWTSSPVNITITGAASPPFFMQAPVSQTALVGGNATLSALLGGTPPLSYQWLFKGTILPGATNSSLVLLNVQTNQEGFYRLIVTNQAGGVSSPGVSVSVYAPPSIVGQPASQTVSAGTNVTLSVVATSRPDPIYQWRFNGVDIAGATTANLVLTNVQLSQAGSYDVRVLNWAGEAISATAVLAVTGTSPFYEPTTVPRDDFWITDGPVYAIYETNGAAYLGGAFSYVGPNTGGGALADSEQGLLDLSFPRVDGIIKTIISDGTGGWYVGGSFTFVGGIARHNLARIRSDRSVDPVFAPNPAGGAGADAVETLLLAGGQLYAGGSFTNVGGAARTNFVELNTATGLPTANAWHADNTVNTLTLDGTNLYLGGRFTRLAGVDRKNLARLDLVSGAVTAWNPSANNTVFAMVVTNGAVYAAGEFTSIGGSGSRPYLAALSASSGALISNWEPEANGRVRALALDGNGILYVGGDFSEMGKGGTKRACLAALNLGSFTATSLNLGVSSPVWALNLQGGSLYFGGQFTNVAGQRRERLARADTQTGQLQAWNPSVGGRVLSLAKFGNYVLAGGEFKSAGGVSRRNAAALDTVTGAATAWNPDANRTVRALAVYGTAVYLGGEFTQAGGTNRPYLTAVDAVSGQLLPWAGAPDDRVDALLVANASLYIGGAFTKYGGSDHERIAAANLSSGAALTGWRPEVESGEVFALGASAGIIYVGGSFSRVSDGISGNVTRSNLAAFGAGDGLLTAWNPGADGVVRTLASAGNSLIVGGAFGNVGGAPRGRLALLSAADGSLLGWDANLNNSASASNTCYVSAASLVGGNLFIGGLFTEAGSRLRQNLAGLYPDAAGTNEALTAWNPNAGGEVFSLFASGNAIYAGGSFLTLGGGVRPYLAVFSAPRSPVIISQPRSVTAPVGGTASFNVAAASSQPLTYQWRFNGANLVGATNTALSLPALQTNQSGVYSVLVSNSVGVVLSSEVLLTVLRPPVILEQPASLTNSVGELASFWVTTDGSEPLAYQWQKNNQDLAGETNNALTLANVLVADSGNYRVLVGNGAGTVASSNAVLLVSSANSGVLQDFFADSALVTDASGAIRGSNVGATREPQEPKHAEKPGGKSMWFTWRAPATGVATFDTIGSDFDTLLAVYVGTNVAHLDSVADDEDGGGFFASRVEFNAVAGRDYHVAVDGFGGAAGNIVVNWTFEENAGDVPVLGRIQVNVDGGADYTNDISVAQGQKVILSIRATSELPLAYQWHHNGVEMPGETQINLVIANFGRDNVGEYLVRVSSPTRGLFSQPLNIEMGTAPQVTSKDKLQDVVAADNGSVSPASKSATRRRILASLNVSPGVLGTQVLNNFGATTGQEDSAGNLAVKASKWFPLTFASQGTLVLDTIGSDVDTVLEIYSVSNLNVPLASDDDSAPDGVRSVLSYAVTPGDHLVRVGSKSVSTGTITLNYVLGEPTAITVQPDDVASNVGANAQFSVLATGTPATGAQLAYQWRFNGVELAGQTGASLTLTNVQPYHAGDYDVVVNGLLGALTSRSAALVVNETISFGPATFSSGRMQVSVYGTPGRNYIVQVSTNLASASQWQAVATNNATDGQFLYLDDSNLSTNAPLIRFFRAAPAP